MIISLRLPMKVLTFIAAPICVVAVPEKEKFALAVCAPPFIPVVPPVPVKTPLRRNRVLNGTLVGA
jgi:hypothetical protein